MSTQRVCDLDNTIINPATDAFYSVKDGRTGREKDICIQCARTKALPIWVASTAVQAGSIIKPTGTLGRYAFQAINSGNTGATEPSWPTAQGHAGESVTDGGVTWLVILAPNEAATVKVNMPGTTSFKTSIVGWMSGSNEPVA